LFIKHTNACGAGIEDDPVEAYRRAYLGDPNAAMGGILAVSFAVDSGFAEKVMNSLARWGKETGAVAFFVEVWIAPTFDKAAVEVIRSAKKWGQRVRLLTVGDMGAPPVDDERDFKKITGGMLMQTRDTVGLNEDQWKIVTDRTPTDAEMADLRLAWLICKHTKSNAITVCKDGMLIGNGAGQMSRIMSCRIATWLAKENGHADKLAASVAASDAFFPFRDGPDILADAGVTAIIQPGGSKRDADTIAACNERGLAMIFTGTRHFKH
jgi:phosphoribosylaminoimidazolecarboxamide formyltransferase/IMP cyclohydrolase